MFAPSSASLSPHIGKDALQQPKSSLYAYDL